VEGNNSDHLEIGDQEFATKDWEGPQKNLNKGVGLWSKNLNWELPKHN